jgi:hypothetical protein
LEKFGGASERKLKSLRNFYAEFDGVALIACFSA